MSFYFIYSTYVFFFYFLSLASLFFFFFFNDTATTEIYTLSLHDALPICTEPERVWEFAPSVRLGTVVPACSPAGTILCGLRSQLQSYWGYHLLPVCGVADSGYSLDRSSASLVALARASGFM